VRIIDADGGQVGVFTTKDAIKMAQEKSLDLVEVAPNSKPPVCKFIDYGKYKYHQSKIDHKHRVKQRSNELKEIRLTPRISKHDLETKANHAKKFIEKGNRVKFNLIFRGREIEFIDIGKERLDTLTTFLEEISIIDQEVTRQGHCLSLILKPLS